MSDQAQPETTLPPVPVDPQDEAVLAMICVMRPGAQRDSLAMWLNNPDGRMPYLHIDREELRRLAQDVSGQRDGAYRDGFRAGQSAALKAAP